MKLSAGLLAAVLAAYIASESKASESKAVRSFMDGNELHRLCNSSFPGKIRDVPVTSLV
jgi:hypothetical protein